MSPRASWAQGSARYAIERQTAAGLLVVAVQCRLGLDGDVHAALLDTGAQWSVIGGELAGRVQADAELTGLRVRMKTRHGPLEGELARLDVLLLAESGHGQDFVVDATVLLLPDWPGPSVVLGTRGLLERVRFELDPDQRGEDCWWSFAAARP